MKRMNSRALIFVVTLLLSFTATMTIPHGHAFERKRNFKAMLIGIDYTQSGGFNFTRNATALRDALLTWSCWKTSNITVMGAKVNKSHILGNLSSLKIGPDDFFLFYYSGHGLCDRPDSANEKSPPAINARDEWLLPSRTPPSRIKDDELVDAFRKFDQKATKVVVLDTCYAGGFWNGNDEGDLESLRNISLLAAVPEGKKAPAQSYFTGALVQGIKRNQTTRLAPADTNNDSTVTPKEWFDYAKNNVPPGPIFGNRKEEDILENLDEMVEMYNEPWSDDIDNILNLGMICSPFNDIVGGIKLDSESLNLLAPYIGVTLVAVTAIVAKAVHNKHVKQRKNKQ